MTRTRLEHVAVLGFLVALTLIVLVPASPLVQKLPSWDSGIFLYSGWRITLGDLLYLDVWDHKPPLIFFINALGVFLANGSRWGVWAIEVVIMLAAALVGFDLIRRAFGVLTAVYASVAWMVNAFVTMDGGNYTTEYALPLQFGLLWLVGTAPESGISRWRALAVGILSGLLFWLRQNDIGIPLAIVLLYVLYFFRGRRGEMLRALAFMIGGALVVSVFVIVPFFLQGTLADFWEAAFLYNFEYIDDSWFDRLVSLKALPITLPAFGLTTLAFVGWLIAALAFLDSIRRNGSVWTNWINTLERLCGERTNNNPTALTQLQVASLLTLTLIALPIECMLVSMSGNGFDHYFLALLPVFAVLAALSFRILLAALERADLGYWVRVAFVALVLGLLLVLSTEYVRPIFQRLLLRDEGALIAYILANTGPQDRILIWGGELRVNFEAKRATSIRYPHTGLLSSSRESVQSKLRRVMQDLRKKPRWIIREPDSEPLFSQFAATEPEIAVAAREFLKDYQFRQAVNEWSVYELAAR